MPTLNWIGREAVATHHFKVPFHLLRDVPDMGCGDDSDNLIVQGDNLVVLKALLPYYRGQVKCIYIDPPYNTGNEGWIYNDNVNSPVMREWLGKVVGKEGEMLDRHDRWLCMMYPRLSLLWEFLREDGAIFVSLDDNEIHNLRVLMDGIFGTKNFVANIVWQKRTSPDARLQLGPAHDYITCYAKQMDSFKKTINPLKLSEQQAKSYKNPDNDPRGLWTSTDCTAQAGHGTKDQFYTLTTPAGRVVELPNSLCWRFTQKRMQEEIAAGRIWFGKDGKGVPRKKTYLSENEGVVPWTWWDNKEVGHNQEATKELISIMGANDVFDTPKPVRLIDRIIQISTNSGDLILDSFAGSGTTGHAVLKLNADNPDKPSRRFILVELEPTIANPVTAERVRRVARGYTNAKGEKIAGLGGGFRFCELGDPLADATGNIRLSVKFGELARHVWFSETGTPLPRVRVTNNPLLGVHNGTAIYLLYNGVLGDESVNGGNVLTRKILAMLPPHDGPRIVYCAGCLLGAERLRAERIQIRQTPYAIKTA